MAMGLGLGEVQWEYAPLPPHEADILESMWPWLAFRAGTKNQSALWSTVFKEGEPDGYYACNISRSGLGSNKYLLNEKKLLGLKSKHVVVLGACRFG